MGADICGIASVDRFKDAPRGYSPLEVLPSCRSVIVLALRSVNSTLASSTLVPYTIMRNDRYQRLNFIALQLSQMIEDDGWIAVPIPAGDPCKIDMAEGKLKGIISLKHAAEQAGLGNLGRNTLLINDKYGNMLWLSAVLTTAELRADPVATYAVCPENCSLCISSCPVNALDGRSIDQRKCGQYAFDNNQLTGWQIRCNTCRKICPNCQGIEMRDFSSSDVNGEEIN